MNVLDCSGAGLARTLNRCSNLARMSDAHVMITNGRSSAVRAGIRPLHVLDVWLAAAKRQRTDGDLVNLSAGQPSAGAPRAVRESAKRSLDSGPLGYSVALGIPELRTAIASSYADRHGLA